MVDHCGLIPFQQTVTDRGIFCDSAQLRPVVATPERPTTGVISNPPGLSSGLQRQASTHIQGGCRIVFRSESFPVVTL